MEDFAPKWGKVFLVGAGPGDPGLLTVKGRELLEIADAIVYDYLADESLLRHAKPQAELIDVGKRPSRPMVQEKINEILLEAARRHEVVVRLKGGDPMLFGRGGEELLALRAAGVAFEVVPGVSSAIAVPAYAGIPVTHRGVSASVTIITGHRQAGGEDDIDYSALARLGGTIVVLMGVGHRAEIASRLIDAGMSPSTPVAAVRWGTRLDQETLRGVLGELGDMPLKSPAVIVVGAVANFDLAFFETRPLFGVRVVVTRALEQQGQLARKLEELGAQVVAAPVIRIAPPSDEGRSMREALSNLSQFDWVVLTSVNGVEAFFSGIDDLRSLGPLRIAVVGAATRRAVESRGVRADLVPSRFVGEALVAEFPEGPGKVLLAQAAQARPVVAQGLRAKGFDVVTVQAYQTLPYVPQEDESAELKGAEAICFTSSSTVTGFLDTYGAGALPPVVVSIGPVTTDTASQAGIEVTRTADVHDLDGLIEALVQVITTRAGI